MFFNVEHHSVTRRKHTGRCSWGLEVRSGAQSAISRIRWLELHNTNGGRGRGWDTDKDRKLFGLHWCWTKIATTIFFVNQRKNRSYLFMFGPKVCSSRVFDVIVSPYCYVCVCVCVCSLQGQDSLTTCWCIPIFFLHALKKTPIIFIHYNLIIIIMPVTCEVYPQ